MRTAVWCVMALLVVGVLALCGCGGGGSPSRGYSSLEAPAREFTTWPTMEQLQADLAAVGKIVPEGLSAEPGTQQIRVEPTGGVHPATAYLASAPWNTFTSGEFVQDGSTKFYENKLNNPWSRYRPAIRVAADGDADLYVYAPHRGYLGTGRPYGYGLKLVGYSVLGPAKTDAVSFYPGNFGGPGWFLLAVYGYGMSGGSGNQNWFRIGLLTY